MAFTVAGTRGLKAGQKADGSVEYRVRYRLKATSNPGVDTAVYAKLALGVSLGDAFVNDYTALCNSIDIDVGSRINDGTGVYWEWFADIGYASSFGGGLDPANPPQEPTDKPATISVTSETYTEAARKDISDERIVNAAGDPIIIEKKRGRLIIRISKSFSRFDGKWASESPGGYRYTRNQATWRPFAGMPALGVWEIAAGNALCTDLKVSVAYHGKAPYAQVDGEFHTDEVDGFQSKFVQQGFFYKTAAGDGDVPKLQFVDQNGYAATPQLLDADGLALAAGEEPVIGAFQLYPLADWSVLKMPR